MDSPLAAGGAEQNAQEVKLGRSEPPAHRFHEVGRIGARKNPGAVLGAKPSYELAEVVITGMST